MACLSFVPVEMTEAAMGESGSDSESEEEEECSWWMPLE